MELTMVEEFNIITERFEEGVMEIAKKYEGILDGVDTDNIDEKSVSALIQYFTEVTKLQEKYVEELNKLKEVNK